MDELYGVSGHQELPDLDDLDYMGDPTAPLQAKAEGGVEQELLLDNDLVRRVLEAVHGGRAEEIDPGLFRAVLELLGEAADEGERRSSVAPGEEFRQRVDYNNAVFAAFKVHRFQGDLVRQLTDSNGVLKPFNQWLNDVQGIVSHHCGTWLRTEYDTAVIRMQQASDWQRFERDKDIMPCLEWMPSTSLHPGADHKVFWGTVRPVDDPFWTSHRPGDRWNCKCWLQNTDKAPTPLPEGMEEKENRPAPGLDNNPGQDAKLFADSHPYIAEAYPGAEETVEKTLKKEKIEKFDNVPVRNGSVRVSSMHGKKERAENIRVATYLAEKYGYDIDLIANPEGRKSADSFNRTLGIEQEYKVNSTPTKSSIDNLLRSGAKQADHIVLVIDSEIPLGELRNAIKDRVERTANIKSIVLSINKKDKTYKREEIINDEWEIKQADFE